MSLENVENKLYSTAYTSIRRANQIKTHQKHIALFHRVISVEKYKSDTKTNFLSVYDLSLNNNILE